MTPDTGADSPILIAYDGSDHSKAAIEQAAAQLRTPRAAIVLSVFEPLTAIPFWGAPYGRVPAELVDEAGQEARRVAAEGAALAKEAGFDSDSAVIEGAPVWERIVAAAKERGAGMIVMGSHGRSGVSYVAMGSVATAVAHHAAAPVLICRAREN
jgi:nucleotide-binding universal stress UspA family protein